MVLAGQWSDLLRYSGPLAIFLLLAWAALWSPYVECVPSGVRLQNVFSIVTLPWPAIRGVDGRFGLTLRHGVRRVHGVERVPTPTAQHTERSRGSA